MNHKFQYNVFITDIVLMHKVLHKMVKIQFICHFYSAFSIKLDYNPFRLDNSLCVAGPNPNRFIIP